MKRASLGLRQSPPGTQHQISAGGHNAIHEIHRQAWLPATPWQKLGSDKGSLAPVLPP